jgi:hypothetical protein
MRHSFVVVISQLYAAKLVTFTTQVQKGVESGIDTREQKMRTIYPDVVKCQTASSWKLQILN